MDHEPDSGGLSRRELLTRGAAMGAVVALPAVGSVGFGTSWLATAEAARPVVLTPDQSALLEAIVDRLIPSDANGPGGKEAGAAAYIERELGGGLAGGLSATAPLYTAGLPAVDAYSTSAYGAPFLSLPPARQDAVLADLQAGKAPWPGDAPGAQVTGSATFFGVLREHTLQGMFGDPVYGGNRDFAGWNLVGYPGVKMPFPAAEQRVGVTVQAAHKSTYANGAFAKAKQEATK